MYNINIPDREIQCMEGMQNVQTVYLAGDPRTAAKLLQRLLLMKPEKAYPFSGGYAFSLAFFRYLCYTDKEKKHASFSALLAENDTQVWVCPPCGTWGAT